MMKLRPILRQWQCVYFLGPAYDRMHAYRSQFGILNIHTMPPNGENFQSNQYHGFLFSFSFRHPFAVIADWLYDLLR